MDNGDKQPNSKFIVFEGIDGSGKTTQIKLLQMALTNQGIVSSISAEPTSLPSGIEIRKILAGEQEKNPLEIAKLFTLDRIAHNTDKTRGIEKMLNDKITVISDRYYYSSMAYQGAHTGIDQIIEMNINNPNIRRPDLCIFLDLTPEQSMERIKSSRDSFEIFETPEILCQTRDMFYKVIKRMRGLGDNIVTIDASREVEEVSKDILATVLDIYNE